MHSKKSRRMFQLANKTAYAKVLWTPAPVAFNNASNKSVMLEILIHESKTG